jgi:hypothetical protein
VPATAVPATAVPATAVPATTVPATTGPRSSSDAWAMASAFSAGGLVALAGVALGWAIARRSQRG